MDLGRDLRRFPVKRYGWGPNDEAQEEMEEEKQDMLGVLDRLIEDVRGGGGRQ